MLNDDVGLHQIQFVPVVSSSFCDPLGPINSTSGSPAPLIFINCFTTKQIRKEFSEILLIL